MINVLVADDHPIIRQGIRQILSDTSDIVVKDEAGNGNETLGKIRQQAFDVVILDLSLPGISGMEVLKQIKREKPELPVLILSRYSEEQFAVPALKAGASGYVSKTTIVEDLVKAVRRVSTSLEYISPGLSQKMFDRLRKNQAESLHAILSDRELEVLCEIAAGKSVQEIARECFLSPTTVSTYRSRILRKMGLKNNAELVRYALDNDLIE